MMMSSIDRTITVCENERAWIGRGFSSGGLLPTGDRGAFSSEDGSLSFPSLHQAQQELLTPGYSYVDEEEDERDDQSPDPDWLYAWDFTARAVASAQVGKRGPLHWVRFRYWKRPVQLDVSTIFPSLTSIPNNHIDSQAVKRVSTLILHVSAYISLLIIPVPNSNKLTDAIMLPVKKRILQILQGFSMAPIEDSDAVPTVYEALDALCSALEELAEDERTRFQHLLSKMGSFAKRESHPGWEQRCIQVDEKYWPERTLLAGWMIRVLGNGTNTNTLYCRNADCPGDCGLLPLPCPNEGCREDNMSQKYLETHAQTCPFTIIECGACGLSFPRRLQSRHLQDECPLRDAKCPYMTIGCTTSLLQAKDIPEHLEQKTQQHLGLALTRLLEVQDVVKNQNTRILTLEDETARLKQMLATQQDLAKKESLAATKKISGLVNRIASLETSTKNEILQLKRSHVK